ncbi:MAG: hypothetical protein ACJ8CR_39265 [Roseiflexaceae bacterium]
MRSDTLPRPVWLLAITLTSLFVLWLTWPGPSTGRLISRWRPEPMLTQPDQPAQLANPPPPALSGVALPVAAQLDLSVDAGLYDDQRAQLADDMQQALAYVVGRFGSGPSARFRAAILLDAGCGLHGIAYTDIRAVQTYTCPDIGRDRVVAIMAHEFVHQLEQDRYGPAHLRADLILSEGMATWGAGKYWLGGKPDFRTFVREQRAGGMFYPLATNYSGLGIAAMNALYYEWASFVDFLITTYGREQFDKLYINGASAPGSADYAGVYGKGLDALEREWQAWLDHE